MKNDMCGARGTQGRRKRCIVGRPEGETDHLEYLGVNGRIILKLIFKCGMGELTYLDQYRDKWWVLVNA